jgi:hypothetical protein
MDLIAGIDTIQKSLRALANHLIAAQDELRIDLHPRVQAPHLIGELTSVITTLDYSDLIDLSKVSVLQGAVGCSSETIHLVQASNQAKIELIDLVKQIQAPTTEHRRKWFRSLLAKEGLQSLSLKHLYRQITILEETPRKISFLKCKNSSHLPISYLEAEKQLLSLSRKGVSVDIQLSHLQKLDRSRQKLVRYKSIQESHAVNVFLANSISKYATSLPVFYQQDLNKEGPVIQFSDDTSPRKLRSDRKISDEPFLPSIGVFLVEK